MDKALAQFQAEMNQAFDEMRQRIDRMVWKLRQDQLSRRLFGHSDYDIWEPSQPEPPKPEPPYDPNIKPVEGLHPRYWVYCQPDPYRFPFREEVLKSLDSK